MTPEQARATIIGNLTAWDVYGIIDQLESEYEKGVLREIVDAAKALAESSGWISVKERLPDAEGRYFATDGYKVGEGIFLDGKMYACDLSPFLTEDITHWQPLPEPPKEGENE